MPPTRLSSMKHSFSQTNVILRNAWNPSTSVCDSRCLWIFCCKLFTSYFTLFLFLPAMARTWTKFTIPLIQSLLSHLCPLLLLVSHQESSFFSHHVKILTFLKMPLCTPALLSSLGRGAPLSSAPAALHLSPSHHTLISLLH